MDARPPALYWIERVKPLRLALMPAPRSGEQLAADVRAWTQTGIDTVVSLIEPAEALELGLLEEAALCAAGGIEFISLPIADCGTPQSSGEVAALVEAICSRLRSGAGVAVHCRAGIGRSGLLTACVLLTLGIAQDEVFATITLARGITVPETAAQAAWFARFAQARFGRR